VKIFFISSNNKMPLSSALQARLIERGILNAANINAALGLLIFIY